MRWTRNGWGYTHRGDNIRILHWCEVRIENSVPRVTVWHHKALPSDAKQWSRGTEFSVRTKHSCLILFLHTFRFRMFYFKSGIHYHIQWCWRRTFFKLTSLWRQNHVNLTTKLRDILYNQCKPNSCEQFLFGNAKTSDFLIRCTRIILSHMTIEISMPIWVALFWMDHDYFFDLTTVPTTPHLTLPNPPLLHLMPTHPTPTPTTPPPHPTQLNPRLLLNSETDMSHHMTKLTNWRAPSKVSDQPLRCPHERKLRSLAIHKAHSEDSDQTGWMPRLIWVFAGCTCHFVGFVMRWLIRWVFDTNLEIIFHISM